MSILKLLFFKHVSVKSQGSSGGVVFLILILLMKILAVITKLIKKVRCQFLKEGRLKAFSMTHITNIFN